MQRTLVVGLVVILFTGIGLSACAPAPVADPQTQTPTREGTLRPYPSPTQSATPLPTDYVTPTASATVTPTMTPVYYDVVDGDDMYYIGWRFNVSPQQIMTANPSVNPRAMGPGTTLLIPITPAPDPTATPLVELSPTATPPFANIQVPDCYPDVLGGLWCFVLVTNDGDEPVENVSGVVTLRQDEDAWKQTAIMPLNLLPAGAALPLITYFQPPLPAVYTISARVDFLLPVMPGDQRYLPVTLSEEMLEFSEDGQVATVTGMISLPAGQPAARYAWINATAFDADGRVLAVRRWEVLEPLTGGTQQPFTLYLYSLGGPIERVDLLAEAQPELEPPNED